MILSSIKNCDRYLFNDDFKLAFQFLQETDLEALESGKTVLNDNVYVLKSAYETIEVGETYWEAHNKYVDIQYMVKGEELIGASERYKLKEKHYLENKDLVGLKGKIDNFVRLTKDDFAIFFPEDAHMPQICVDDRMNVEKVVVKVRIND